MAGLLLLALILAACGASGPQTSLDPAGPIADNINDLWLLVFRVGVAVFVIVEGVLVYAIWRFRERKDDDRRPKQVHGNTALEITWTIVPAVLLAALTIPMLQGLFEMRQVPTGNVLHINVTGHQWWWEFEYVNETAPDGRTIVTANELHIPNGRDVYLTMTSADVIHSFWLPALNGKRDVVPGRITNLTLHAYEPTSEDQPHLGQCAEFCGLAHADMRLKAFVHNAADYSSWVAEQLAPTTAVGEGWDTFSVICTQCHQVTITEAGSITTHGPDRFVEVDGTTFRASFAPNLTHFGSRTSFGGATFPNDVEHLTAWVDNPTDLKPMAPERNIFPTAEEQEEGQQMRMLGMQDYSLDDREIASVVALLRSWK